VTPCYSTRSILASTSQPKKGLKPSTINLASIRNDSGRGVYFRGLGLNNKLCLPLYLPLLVCNKIIFKGRKIESIKQSGVYPRKNETKVITINGIT